VTLTLKGVKAIRRPKTRYLKFAKKIPINNYFQKKPDAERTRRDTDAEKSGKTSEDKVLKNVLIFRENIFIFAKKLYYCQKKPDGAARKRRDVDAEGSEGDKASEDKVFKSNFCNNIFTSSENSLLLEEARS
jgi:hypothetical protein